MIEASLVYPKLALNLVDEIDKGISVHSFRSKLRWWDCGVIYEFAGE